MIDWPPQYRSTPIVEWRYLSVIPTAYLYCLDIPYLICQLSYIIYDRT